MPHPLFERKSPAATSIAALLFVITPTFAGTMLFVAMSLCTASAQSFKVLYVFSGGADGWLPSAGLTLDQQGNLYGTTSNGGLFPATCYQQGCGTVFELVHHGTEWTLKTIYRFKGGLDSEYPT